MSAVAPLIPRAPKAVTGPTDRSDTSRALVRDLSANELIFAVVGAVGAGTSEVARALAELLKGRGYDTAVLKARKVIEQWASEAGHPLPAEPKMEQVRALQNAGDELRKSFGEHGAVARLLIGEIRAVRASKLGVSLTGTEAIEPDGAQRAYILDSVRHPAEIALLRGVYRDAFCVVGVVCDDDTRAFRLRSKFPDAGSEAISAFTRRDENAPEKHGQKVAEAFHLADFFIDNRPDRLIHRGHGQPVANPAWDVPDQLDRLVDILGRTNIIRPAPDETAMFHAHGAGVRSACLSRQVGAALMSDHGLLLATGTNEVPRAGGGLYGDPSTSPGSAADDARCFIVNRFCSNTREQNSIIEELFSDVAELSEVVLTEDLKKRIRKTRLGQIIEFSRAVHAEMDAIVSAARQGVSPSGAKMYVTTFPCHNCARHIVAAGISEVQFIEPYLKSRALKLHGDAITTTFAGKSQSLTAQGHQKAPMVLFRPFTGVAPRLYRRAFLKDRDLKNGDTGDMLVNFGPSDGTSTEATLRVSYAEVEARVTSQQSVAAE